MKSFIKKNLNDEEQAILFEKQIIDECISAERFVDWIKDNDKSSDTNYN